MSERISPRPCSPMIAASSEARVVTARAATRGRRPGAAPSLTALLLVGAFGCSNAGSNFDMPDGGGQASGSGGASASGSGGSGSVASGGSPGTGSGGTTDGTGGSSTSGSGGAPVTGTGGETVEGTGGSSTTGSGGAQSSGSGGASTGSGGSNGGSSGAAGAAASGGRTGSGGTAPGTGGASTGSGGAGTGSGGAVAATCPKGATAICHEFIANDNGKNQVNYVNEFDPSKNWTKAVGQTGANSPRTIEIVDNAKAKGGKAVLVSLEKGYGEFDLTDGTSLGGVATKSGISGACRMPDGNTALGTNNAIIVVSPSGSEVKQITLPAGDELRAINRNPADGHFWFSKVSMVYDMAESGAVSWMGNMGAGTKGYAVWWREGGGAYATTGDPSTVVEMDATGKVISTVGGKAMFTSVGLDFFSGFVRLSNGNFVVANWLGHLSNPGKDTPHVVEFTPQNKVVWQWGNQTLARQITNVYVFR